MSMFRFERSREALLSIANYYARVAKCFVITLFIVAFSLTFGTSGYCYFGEMSLVDGLLNSSMILTGMGPVDKMTTTSGKLFAALYALYSGIAFLSMMAVLMAPILHRFMHRFHLEDRDE